MGPQHLSRGATVDTVHHTILECPRFDTERRGLRSTTIPELVSEMLQTEESWNFITRKVGCILKKEQCLPATAMVSTQPAPQGTTA